MRDILKWTVYGGIFTVPFLVLWISSSMFFPYITGKNFGFRIIVEVMFAAWVLLALYEPRYRPQFSWIAAAGLGLLVVMFFANLLGEYPPKSFWSNFERMEGYVTLVHFYLYFLITATMLTTEKLWNRFFNATLAAAVLVCFYAFAQLAGALEISQGGSWRVDSTLGNSTYMAVYMLFHIFIAVLMATRARTTGMRLLYSALAALFIFMLFQTGTRGAALGLVGGTFLFAAYLALFANKYPRVRKLATGGLVAVLLVVAGFIAVRDSAFVQDSHILNRLASISLDAGEVRFMIWGIALEGIKERPILGWGQGNFNYVFNEHYVPELYRAEAWYDRVHNIVLDWLIAGGIIGAFFYFGIIAAAVYYAALRPLALRLRNMPADDAFSPVERGLLLGILAAYVFHNLFVFDNIVSYIFFAVVLAFIHGRVSTPIARVDRAAIDPTVITKVAVPIAVVLLVATVYVVNVPPMLAAKDIIDGFRGDTLEARFGAFERALSRDTFGDQEVAEHFANEAAELARQPSISRAEAGEYVARAEDALLTMMEEKPNDPRFHVFLASLYRSAGRFDDAALVLAAAHELSPGKTSIMMEQGVVELLRGDTEAARQFFKTAYELAPSQARARMLYGALLLEEEDAAKLREVLLEEDLPSFASDGVVHAIVSQGGHADFARSFFREYARTHPTSTAALTAYASFEYSIGNADAARAILESARAAAPSFAPQFDCYAANIAAKKEMTAVCS